MSQVGPNHQLGLPERHPVKEGGNYFVVCGRSAFFTLESKLVSIPPLLDGRREVDGLPWRPISHLPFPGMTLGIPVDVMVVEPESLPSWSSGQVSNKRPARTMSGVLIKTAHHILAPGRALRHSDRLCPK